MNSCGIYEPSDARQVSPNADERVKKILKKEKVRYVNGWTKKVVCTNYQFASSNPMWRATLEILDFLPLANVIIQEGLLLQIGTMKVQRVNESLKITVRFLTNEIRVRWT